MKQPQELTELQLAIINVVWERGECSVREVHARLARSTGLAVKTIGTLLHRLTRQGMLTFRPEGREYLYRATVSRESVQAAYVKQMVGSVFHGDVPALVSFALGTDQISQEDVERIRNLLADRTKRKRP
jgi:BlaI family transcriptional regulator, penicillinase repressor